MGHVTGGWPYVLASYGIAWFSLAAFSISLYLRRSKEK
jgi:cytochrome oxidase assembly protein ShyY1